MFTQPFGVQIKTGENECPRAKQKRCAKLTGRFR